MPDGSLPLNLQAFSGLKLTPDRIVILRSNRGNTIPGCFFPFSSTHFFFNNAPKSSVNFPTQYRQVPYAKIDLADTRYQLLLFNSEKSNKELRRSIRTYGILLPPLLLEQSSGNFIVLSGKQRLQIDAELSENRAVTALVADNTCADQPQLLFPLLIQHQIIGSSLSLIEQAVFFKKAREEGLHEKELLQFLPLLGYKQKNHIPGELIALLKLDTVVQQELHNGSMALRSAKKLLGFTAGEQRVLAKVIKNFQLGGSKQQKLIDLIFELGKRTGTSAEKLLTGWQKTEQDKQGNGPQKSASLLNWLQQQCRPRSVAAEEDFQEFCRRLKLPPGVQLQHTPSFEDERLSLVLEFNSREDLKKKWPQLKTTVEQDS